MTVHNLFSYSLLSENVKIQIRKPYVIILFCADIIVVSHSKMLRRMSGSKRETLKEISFPCA